MTIDPLVYYVVFGMLVAAFAMTFKSVHDIEKMKDKLANANDAIRYTRNDYSELTRKLIMIEKDLGEMKKGHSSEVTFFESRVAQMSSEIDILRRDIAVQIDMLNNELNARITDKEANKNDIKKEAVDEDIIHYPETYRWIFPGSDQTSGKECPPVYGERYLVVGTIKDFAFDETKIVAEDATYGKNGFFYSDSNYRFDKVYAYIKLPSSSDIWQKVLSLAIEAEE